MSPEQQEPNPYANDLISKYIPDSAIANQIPIAMPDFIVNARTFLPQAEITEIVENTKTFLRDNVTRNTSRLERLQPLDIFSIASIYTKILVLIKRIDSTPDGISQIGHMFSNPELNYYSPQYEALQNALKGKTAYDLFMRNMAMLDFANPSMHLGTPLLLLLGAIENGPVAQSGGANSSRKAQNIDEASIKLQDASRKMDVLKLYFFNTFTDSVLFQVQDKFENSPQGVRAVSLFARYLLLKYKLTLDAQHILKELETIDVDFMQGKRSPKPSEGLRIDDFDRDPLVLVSKQFAIYQLYQEKQTKSIEYISSYLFDNRDQAGDAVSTLGANIVFLHQQLMPEIFANIFARFSTRVDYERAVDSDQELYVSLLSGENFLPVKERDLLRKLFDDIFSYKILSYTAENKQQLLNLLNSQRLVRPFQVPHLLTNFLGIAPHTRQLES